MPLGRGFEKISFPFPRGTTTTTLFPFLPFHFYFSAGGDRDPFLLFEPSPPRTKSSLFFPSFLAT